MSSPAPPGCACVGTVINGGHRLAEGCVWPHISARKGRMSVSATHRDPEERCRMIRIHSSFFGAVAAFGVAMALAGAPVAQGAEDNSLSSTATVGGDAAAGAGSVGKTAAVGAGNVAGEVAGPIPRKAGEVAGTAADAAGT